jgi:pimeloyl-ACP methyl ester carboxylesterase
MTTATAELQTVELAAGSLDYRVTGPLNGKPVVFVHAFLVTHTVWGEVPDLLAARGVRSYAPTWPLGAHSHPMRANADLSPQGLARLVLDFLEALDLHDVTIVGNDTGGAISQLVAAENHPRVGRLVLTNCDAFEVFPPFPFNLLFRLARHPNAARLALMPMRAPALRHSPLAFGPLARSFDAARTEPWVLPYLSNADVRRDLAAFARAWRPDALQAATERIARFERPVLVAWAPEDRFFPISLGRRLAQLFPNATLVEIPGAKTFVALDQPELLATHIAEFLGR